jgi:hypothetical protein
LQLKVYGGRELSRWQLVCTEQRCHGREESQYAGNRRIAFVFGGQHKQGGAARVTLRVDRRMLGTAVKGADRT